MSDTVEDRRCSTPSSSLIQVPSTGLDFFEYRRKCFLAGIPYPTTSSNITLPLPTHLSVPIPSSPLPHAPMPIISGTTTRSGSVGYNSESGSRSGPTSTLHIAKLEALLADDGAEELDSVWEAGVGTVYRNLSEGKRLARGLRLGTVIKILRGAWIRDGTWPIDPQTSQAARPPDSPKIGPTSPPSSMTTTTTTTSSTPTAPITPTMKSSGISIDQAIPAPTSPSFSLSRQPTSFSPRPVI